MATLALAAAGAAVGGTLLPAGISVLGATLSGAAIGSQIGAFAGSYVDQALFGASGQGRAVEGPRLSDLHVTASSEGAPVPRVYGRARLGGQVIWATDFEETVVTSSSGGGGKGASAARSSTVTEYRYFANFAVALAEGEITSVGRIWADGAELDLTDITFRVYTGSETQEPDSLIAAREGVNFAPAFRGTAYIVFERLALAQFGNRLPQLSFEVFRSSEPETGAIRGVVLIPGSGEFVYATEPVRREIGYGISESENAHSRQGVTDWSVSLDQLQQTLPSARSVSLIVSWFGTDLRAGECKLKPGVERTEKTTKPLTWRVAGLDRANAYVVSQREGRPAYGGTPSDETVIAAIRDLKARGLSVTLSPFILMDVPEGNALANPYGGASQPAYPWRGRITVHPAAGQPDSVEKTESAADQLAAFVGAARPSHFFVFDGTVFYVGPDEWSLRRMVLHHAYLAKAAGGVDAFVIGSELRGLTQARSGAATYPFVDALVALAADVKHVLGPDTKITYAADWSEYFGHQPADGSGDVYFHLDPLWASDDIDAIGIDLYWPLADWRDGRTHLDYLAGTRSIHDLGYLAGNVHGGEGFDWFYASAEDREAQVRTPITDGAGKPWVFRYKDIGAWWRNAHYNRPGGVEAAEPTAWVPQSKPFWFMEIGCPVVDKGANQPNVFVDPKSSETALPYFSRGTRDDLMQRRAVRALIEAFSPDSPFCPPSANPISEVYGGRMVDLDRIHVYCWDARPYPAFPLDTDVWGDGDNWRLGHWLNGRAASVALNDAVSAILGDYDFAAHDTGGLTGTVPGYVIDRVMSPRDALQPLELAYFFDAIETGGVVSFRHRGGAPAIATLAQDDLVETKAESALLTVTRGQETELPASAKIRFISGTGDYRQAVAEARRLTGASGRVSQADLPIVLEEALAGGIAESWLFEVWASRERASFTLPPSRLAVEPGDVVEVAGEDATRLFRITEIGDQGARAIEALSIDPDVYEAGSFSERAVRPSPPPQTGSPEVAFLDLPLLRGDEPPYAGYVAAMQSPWPGGVAVYGSPTNAGYVLKALAGVPSVMGTTLTALSEGPVGRVDHGAVLDVEIGTGELHAAERTLLLSGANVAAIGNADGEWEVLQFEDAELIAPRRYRLRRLLRGQAGTDFAMRAEIGAGARFVLLDQTITRIDLSPAEIRLPFSWRFGPANRDLGHPSYAETTHTFAGLGLRPLSPVHVRGTRNAAGDLAIGWIRRTRTGGDSWDSPDVPLGEEREAYEVDILSGDSVVRTLAATSSAITYTAAQQVADFGAVQSTCAVRVYQLSAAVGRGAPRGALL
jgi:hypothetical protein